uniref:Uncharacterized protein n=1 Tax=Cucumis melo TaxID=3656 RepID=A0A9I9EM56_CUCME
MEKLSLGYSHSHFLGMNTRSPLGYPISFAEIHSQSFLTRTSVGHLFDCVRRSVKSGAVVTLLCVVLVISISSFGFHTPRTSVYIPGIVPHPFSQSIGRVASSLEGELRSNLERSKRWSMLFQQVANARPVSETNENAFQGRKRAKLKKFWCLSQESSSENAPDSVLPSRSKKRTHTPRIKIYIPGIVPHTLS